MEGIKFQLQPFNKTSAEKPPVIQATYPQKCLNIEITMMNGWCHGNNLWKDKVVIGVNSHDLKSVNLFGYTHGANGGDERSNFSSHNYRYK